MKNALLFLFTISLTFGCIAQDHTKPNLKKLEPKIDALVKQYQDLDIFSGVILIAEEGRPVYHKAFGLANRENKTSNTLNTKFDIGSMNKTFTSIVIQQLLAKGSLNLEDKLGDYLTGFPTEAANKITIEHLLKHSSGYASYWTPEFRSLPIHQKGIEGIVKIIRKLPLNFEPGTEQEYSNAGYVLLGAIIEKVTGKKYHEVVREQIVKPLGLKNTYLTDKYNVPERAIGYYKTMKGELKNNNGMIEVPNPDGGFQSTALDILKLYQEYHYGTTLLSWEDKMKNDYFSRIQEHTNTGGAIPHAGGFPGSNTVNYEILRDKISVVVFANMDEPVAEQLGVGILALIRNKEPKTPDLPAIQNVYRAYTNHGTDFVRNNFKSLISNFHADDPKALILNNMGYELLHDNAIDQANEIFKLNTEMFPEDPNVWDSYAEGQLNKGDKQKALQLYKKALSIDPNFPSALSKVKELEGK